MSKESLSKRLAFQPRWIAIGLVTLAFAIITLFALMSDIPLGSAFVLNSSTEIVVLNLYIHAMMAGPRGDIKAMRLAAAKIDPELFEDAPDSYLPQFLNPCWRSRSSKTMQCLPASFTHSKSSLVEIEAHCLTVLIWRRDFSLLPSISDCFVPF